MTVEDIEKGLGRAWRFVAPPLINLLLLSVLVAFVAPELSQKCVAGLRSFGDVASPDSDQRELFEFLGLAKLIPIMSLVLVAAALLLLQKAILTVGYFFLGRLAILSPANYAVAFQPERLLQLWRWFPAAEELDDLVAAVELRFSLLPVTAKKMHTHWEAHSAVASRLYYTAKFYVVATALLVLGELIVGGSVQWLATTSWLLAAVTIAALSLYNALNAHLQAIHAIVNAVESDLLVKSTSRDTVAEAAQQARATEIQGHKTGNGWWELTWFNLPAWRHVKSLWAGRRREA
jgi:hypothetical protein